MAKAYTEARKEHGASQLLDDIVSEKPSGPHPRRLSGGAPVDLLQHIRDAAALLEQKATPEELAEYRRFMIAPREPGRRGPPRGARRTGE